MRQRKTWLYISIAAVLFAISSVLYLQSHPGSPTPAANGASGNAVRFKAVKEDLSNTVEVKGKSSYEKETVVYAPFTADVAVWGADDGARVNKGDPLFRLDDKELRGEIELQEAGVRKQELEMKLKTVERAAGVGTAASVPIATEADALQRHAQTASKDVQGELDRLNRSIAASELDAKREKLVRAELTAPETGVFLLAGDRKPQKVKEGDAIGKIVDVSKLQMTTSVGEYDVFRIRSGMPAQVTIDAQKQTQLAGKVEKVSPFPKPSNDNGPAQFEVVISLDVPDSLIAGLSLTASIETDNKKGVLTVPTIAVQRDKDGYYVMLETAGGVEKRAITVGLETADKTEVLSGLQEGDTVVLQ